MGERKRKPVGGEERGKSSIKKNKKQRRSNTNPQKEARSKKRRDKRGPGFPTSIWKPFDHLKSTSAHGRDEDIDSDEGEIYANDVYEYEQPMAEEESKKNRRFDPVENFEYELPEQFEDENVLSDDDEENVSGDDDEGKVIKDEDDDELENEDERHARMLQGITGMPSAAFKGRKRNDIVVSEAYPESEYNPSQDVLHGNSRISIEDLLDPLHEKQGYSKLRKRVHQIEKKSIPTQAPLSKVDQEKSERMAAYMKSKKELTMWEPIVKRNREAPSINFGHDVDLSFSTVGAIASEFKPRTEIEKKIASLVHDNRIMEAHRKDGSRLLELNNVSFEDGKDRQNRIAKMRSLLFRHELKAKHIKKIKSKLYRRLLNKDSKKGASQISMDPEAAKELAMKQEFKRAEERMTLKHKNSSKWAKRILSRGLNSQDERTRAAITEQLNQHAILTRKMNSMKDGSSSSSSEESSDDDELDERSNGSLQAGDMKLIEKAKEKALKKLDEEDDTPNTGLLSLPFMVRGLKKRKDAAAEEGKRVIEEFESMSRQLEDSTGTQNRKSGKVSGRMIFGADKTKSPKPAIKVKVDNYYGQSHSEDDHEADESNDVENYDSNNVLKDSHNAMIHDEYSKSDQNSILKSFDETVRDPGPKTSYEVSLFVSNTWKKAGREKAVDVATKISPAVSKPVLENKHSKETMEVVDEDTDTDNEEPTMLSGPKHSYDLPSQAELIHQAFAGDDVEEEFKKDKEEILNQENPEPEKPVLLPGWGQWTRLQQKKGAPSWMTREYTDSKKKREEALKKRKDAQLKHVIISEKIDKKTEKLHTTTLPYPFTSNEVFEQSIRMPIGPEFNPATAIGALNRPEVVKKPGVIIKPIEFVEVNPQEKAEERTPGGQKNEKRRSVKSIKMMKRPAGKGKRNKKREMKNIHPSSGEEAKTCSMKGRDMFE